MRKFLIISSFLLSTLIAKQATAQSNPLGVFFLNSTDYRSIAEVFNLTLETDQITTLPGTHSTYFNGLSQTLDIGGSGTSILMGAVFYYVTPTPLYRLTFSQSGSTNELQVLNGNSTARTYHLTLVYNGETGTPITNVGPSVTIPAGGTGYVYLPTYSQTYNSPNYWVADPTYGFPTLMTIELLPG